MARDELHKEKGVPFAGEYLERYESNLKKGIAIKAWRTGELDAGRPSSLEDYFRAHGFCAGCHGTGIARNGDGNGFKAVGWDGKVQLFEKCGMCGGTGGPGTSPQSSEF